MPFDLDTNHATLRSTARTIGFTGVGAPPDATPIFSPKSAPQIRPPRGSPGSWSVDTHLPSRPLRRVSVRLPGGAPRAAGTMTFGELSGSTTVGWIHENVYQRLLLGPSMHIVLEHLGKPLLDPTRTLRECGVTDEAKLAVRLDRRRPREDRGMDKLRVRSTALRTRVIDVAAAMPEGNVEACTGLDVKQLLEAQLSKEASKTSYNWWDEDGAPIIASQGYVLLCNESAEANEANGTSAVTMGEELILDASQWLNLRSGKGAALSHRIETGQPCYVADAMVSVLELKAEQMKLSYGGAEIADGSRLYDLGCREHDALELEFTSPVTPELLQLMRSPEAEKPSKGGGGKGKGKKK